MSFVFCSSKGIPIFVRKSKQGALLLFFDILKEHQRKAWGEISLPIP